MSLASRKTAEFFVASRKSAEKGKPKNNGTTSTATAQWQ
jgi:hypothetical protein